MDIDDDLSFFTLKTAKVIVFSLVCIFVFDFLLFPIPLLAADINYSDNTDAIEFIKPNIEKPRPVFENSLPQNKDRDIRYKQKFSVTAYNSEVAQCDSTPCITANGFNVCEHNIEDTIATNVLKFGTKVRIPELFGDRVFVVRDRMNPRYEYRIDVWMKKKSHAKMLGLKYVEVEVLN
jgi:3D (Asp-Asp-Asp) domain-containing protein